MSVLLQADAEFLLEALADDGMVLTVTLRPTRKEGGRVMADQVMDEVVAAMHGLAAPDAQTVLFEISGNAFIDGHGLARLRPGVRHFLLRTAHSVLWAACDEAPAVHLPELTHA